MQLSDEERRQLAGIAASMMASDPAIERRLDLAWVGRRQQHELAGLFWFLLLGGALAMVIGVVTANWAVWVAAVSLLAGFACFAGVVVVVRVLWLRGLLAGA